MVESAALEAAEVAWPLGGIAIPARSLLGGREEGVSGYVRVHQWWLGSALSEHQKRPEVCVGGQTGSC